MVRSLAILLCGLILSCSSVYSPVYFVAKGVPEFSAEEAEATYQKLNLVIKLADSSGQGLALSRTPTNRGVKEDRVHLRYGGGSEFYLSIYRKAAKPAEYSPEYLELFMRDAEAAISALVGREVSVRPIAVWDMKDMPNPQLQAPSTGLADLTTGEPNRVITAGDWELRIWYQNLGSRSEGQHGVLLHLGEELPQSMVGQEVKTSFGLMKNYGPKPDGVPWARSGWNYADSSKILASWQLGWFQ